ncbi:MULTISPECIES: HesA/MoeB/ThiF family protein [unclassified Pseudoalteromonas]|uniref:HesA/MoeB/ThiF family protein n=1 Tax=unclassified Pseudoalteromonas TaxID=194690 RepID=UPI000C072794|nr:MULTISPECIES: HesA/MoeB/ThiF family protein [unclassified Pseudoalteromonas]MDP2635817.1 HesA/MoeB/ThiF family protein [Pseudoalteromonas sp. 1_MG-2023]PHN88132.1 molybdopterin-synthase adenylyltransferase MoeB [Pseudoalteromonas sp. 3D05]
MSELSDKEQLRYSRHLMLKEVGHAGQLKLKAGHVVVVGAGGLGSPALLYLAASGVGELTLLDDDKVELSNLQRQVLYKVNHLGQAKVCAAGKVLGSLNNQITVNTIEQQLTDQNAEHIFTGATLVLDCSDNFTTRYTVNRFCLKAGIPLISGAAIASEGQLMCFDFRETDSPCYSCLFPEQPTEHALNCDNAGVLSPLLGVIGSMQALLAINLILGHHKGSQFVRFDGLSLTQQQFKLTKTPECTECGRD